MAFNALYLVERRNWNNVVVKPSKRAGIVQKHRDVSAFDIDPNAVIKTLMPVGNDVRIEFHFPTINATVIAMVVGGLATYNMRMLGPTSFMRVHIVERGDQNMFEVASYPHEYHREYNVRDLYHKYRPMGAAIFMIIEDVAERIVRTYIGPEHYADFKVHGNTDKALHLDIVPWLATLTYNRNSSGVASVFWP